jgi:hypothetical protein
LKGVFNMGKSKKKLVNSTVEYLDYDSEFEEDDGFIEGDIDFSGYAVKSFSFGNNAASLNTPAAQNQIIKTMDAVTSLEHPISQLHHRKSIKKLKKPSPVIWLIREDCRHNQMA